MSVTRSRAIEEIAVDLLDASEAIHAALLGSGDLDSLGLAYDQRASAFGELQGACPVGTELSIAARACIDRVRALDHEIFGLGAGAVEALRGERNALQRRRSAIQAHATREREEPRLITLKA